MTEHPYRQLKSALGPTTDCRPIELLISILDRPSSDAERGATEAHLSGCPHCQTELALYRNFEAGPRAGEEADVAWIASQLRDRSREFRPAGVPWWKQILRPRVLAPMSVALACLVVAITVGLQFRSGSDLPLNTRAGSGVMRSQTVTVVSPLGDIARQPTGLRWQAVAGASRYEARLVEVDGTELWKIESRGEEAAIPADVRDRIVPRKTLLWEVTARDQGGKAIASSGLQRFRLEPQTAPQK